MVSIFDKRAVIDYVACNEDTGGRLPQCDAARGMPRCVNNLELAIAQVNKISILQQLRRRGGRYPVALRGVGLRRQAIENVIGDIGIGKRGVRRWIGQDLRLGRVHRAGFKLIMAADVIEMRVAGDRNQFAFRHQRNVLTEADHAHTTVEQHIPIAPAHVKHVAAVKLFDERLIDKGHAILQGAHTVPVFGAGTVHGSVSYCVDVKGLRLGAQCHARAGLGQVAGGQVRHQDHVRSDIWH